MRPLITDADLPAEERDAILERAARAVVLRRLEVPAILALEMHRPLTFLGSQALVVLTPLLAPAFGLANMQAVVKLLEDRGNLDRLLERIEELTAERNAAGPEAGPGAATESRE